MNHTILDAIMTTAFTLIQDVMEWMIAEMQVMKSAALVRYNALVPKRLTDTENWEKGLKIFLFQQFRLGTCPSQEKGDLVSTKEDGSVGTCVFPFTLNDKTHHKCADTNEYGGVGWCAFDENYVTNRWGYCTESCPSEFYHIHIVYIAQVQI